MEAHVVRVLRAAFVLCVLTLCTGAGHRTQNFVVYAPTKALAIEIGETAERYRVDLAKLWLGHTLPPWQEACPIQANVNPRLGAGGATSFTFVTTHRRFGRPVIRGGQHYVPPAGRPGSWEMTLQGSRERILDSVLPHEITHTIFATHFGRPLPRWADEGACTTVEHASEKNKQHRFLHEFLATNRGIPFNKMFAMSEYPADILPLYAQGFSLAKYLIAQGGRQKFVKYIGTGMDSGDWGAATEQHYGHTSLSDLQVKWLDWVREGSRIKEVAPETPPRSKRSPSTTPPRVQSGWYAAQSQAARSGPPSADQIKARPVSQAFVPRPLSRANQPARPLRSITPPAATSSPAPVAELAKWQPRGPRSPALR